MDDMLTRPVVQGRELRWLLLVVLLDRRRPMQVAELVAAVERSGFALAGRPNKTVADALRCEVKRGRVVRRGRGLYAVGYVAKVTNHRMRGRVAGMWNRRDMPLHPAAAERARTTSM